MVSENLVLTLKFVNSSCLPKEGNHEGIKHKPMCIEDYDKLPFRQSIKPKSEVVWNRDKTYLDFYAIGKKYFKYKIGEHWNDVYSDMIKKTSPKYRHLLERFVNRNYGYAFPIISNVDYIDEIPYMRYYRVDIKCVNKIYINKDGILTFHSTEEELMNVARYRLRQKKLERILNGGI